MPCMTPVLTSHAMILELDSGGSAIPLGFVLPREPLSHRGVGKNAWSFTKCCCSDAAVSQECAMKRCSIQRWPGPRNDLPPAWPDWPHWLRAMRRGSLCPSVREREREQRVFAFQPQNLVSSALSVRFQAHRPLSKPLRSLGRTEVTLAPVDKARDEVRSEVWVWTSGHYVPGRFFAHYQGYNREKTKV